MTGVRSNPATTNVGQQHSEASIKNAKMVGAGLMAVATIFYIILMADMLEADILMDLKTDQDFSSDTYGEYINVSQEKGIAYLGAGIGTTLSAFLIGVRISSQPNACMDLFTKVFPKKEENDKDSEPPAKNPVHNDFLTHSINYT